MNSVVFCYFLQLPPIGGITTLCTKCGKYWDCTKNPKAGKQALKNHYHDKDHDKKAEKERKEKEKLVCHTCGTEFPWKAHLERHICSKAEKISAAGDREFIKYSLKSSDTYLASFIASQFSPYQQYLVCFQEKICIDQVYPPLCLTGGQTTMKSVMQYGRTGGVKFIIDILEEKWKDSSVNGILLDCLIDICNEKHQSIFKIPDDFLTPKSKKLKVEVQGNQILVSLLEPEKSLQLPKKLEQFQFPTSKDDSVYQCYIKEDTPRPHCHNQKELRGQNLFLSPDKLDARALGRYVGMTCKYFRNMHNSHSAW